jgi:hypothetical protein
MHLNKTSNDKSKSCKWKLNIDRNIKLIPNYLNVQRKKKARGEHKNNDIGPKFSHLASMLALLILHKEMHGYEWRGSYKRVHYIKLLVSAMTGTTTITVAVGVAILVRLAVPHRLEILA